MPAHSDHRRRAARSEFLPVAAVILLGAILLGVTTLWNTDTPDAAVDPTVAAPAALAQAVDPSRERHDDGADRHIDGELIEPLDASAVPGSDPAAGAKDLARAAEAHRTTVSTITFRIASFNVLADKHTASGGQNSSWPSASWRTPQAVGYIKRDGSDVVGLQEVKPGQLAGITRGTGFRAWPGGGDPDNSIIYNPQVFEFVSGDAFYIRFMNSDRPQTILRLRHKKTRQEMYFVNMHASAGGGKYAASRAAGHHSAVAAVNRLKKDRIPVFLTGDMNDRAAFFCRVLPPTGMVAAVGGSTGGGCRPPGQMPVDWVVATSEVTFSGYVNDMSTKARRISDHHYVAATATISARG